MPHLITDNQARNFAIASQLGVTNAAGGSAGSSVSTPVSFTDQFGNGLLPGDAGQGRYVVLVAPSQDCFVTSTGKTSTGFNVVLTPTSGSVTLAAGTFDVTVVGL
jgi:hypothetical protein